MAYGSYTQSSAMQSSDVFVGDAPRRQPATLIALKDLEESIASLGSTADCLLARLGAVMSDRPRAAGNTTADSPAATCSLENAIAQSRRSVTVIQQQLVDALERLEV